MIKTGNENINTKVYWDHVYTTPAKELSYWADNRRFPKAIEYVKDGDRFIDLGCGVAVPGRAIQKLKKGCEIWGVDIAEEVIEANKRNDPKSTYYQGYIGSLDFLPENYFDVVFCGEVIEHLEDPAVAFQDAYRILKKGGKFIVTTPESDHITSPEHYWYFTHEDVEKLYKETGFKHIEFVDLDDLEYLLVIFGIGIK
jgi:ubiquinone/menaquinone biosynthesis C-methylase UbiE